MKKLVLISPWPGGWKCRRCSGAETMCYQVIIDRWTLVIPRVISQHDSGNYTCLVSNVHGLLQHSVSVDLLGTHSSFIAPRFYCGRDIVLVTVVTLSSVYGKCQQSLYVICRVSGHWVSLKLAMKLIPVKLVNPEKTSWMGIFKPNSKTIHT